jgi:hypothetical protein
LFWFDQYKVNYTIVDEEEYKQNQEAFSIPPGADNPWALTYIDRTCHEYDKARKSKTKLSQWNKLMRRSFAFLDGFSSWKGQNGWMEGEKAVIGFKGKEKSKLSFKVVWRAPSMKSIDVFLNKKHIKTIDMSTINDGDRIEIDLPPNKKIFNKVELRMTSPSRPIDWVGGENTDERNLGIMTTEWKVE